MQLPPHYDTDAFDSMAVVNSEAWSESRPDEKKLTRSDLLPHVGHSSLVSIASFPGPAQLSIEAMVSLRPPKFYCLQDKL